MNKLILTLQPATLAVCRLDSSSEIPAWSVNSEFFSITKTKDELSIVCPEQKIPEGIKSEIGWRALKIEGPIDFSEIGVLSSVLSPLAEAGISIFAVSTFDTDYILVKNEKLESAVSVLQKYFQINTAL